MRSLWSPLILLSCVCVYVFELIMLVFLASDALWGRGWEAHCGLPHSQRLGFHCSCFVRNQSLLAVTGTVTRGLIGLQTAVQDRVRSETWVRGKIGMWFELQLYLFQQCWTQRKRPKSDQNLYLVYSGKKKTEIKQKGSKNRMFGSLCACRNPLKYENGDLMTYCRKTSTVLI